MKQGLPNQAYTIVEVMIFLAVSSALLVSALLVVGGQQRRTEFGQANRDIESVVRSVVNNVANGYYARAADFNCSAGGSPLKPNISTIGSPTDQGANTGCVFMGRAIQFDTVGSNGEGYNLHNLVGLQYVNNVAPNIPKDATEAALTAMPANFVETKKLQYGLTVVNMTYNPATGGGAQPTRIVAFVNNADSGSFGDDGSGSGVQTGDLYALKTGDEPQTAGEAVTDMEGPGNFVKASQVAVCFKSGGTGQSALLTIGSHGRKLSTTLEIKESVDCT